MDKEFEELLAEFGIPPLQEDLDDGEPPVPVDTERLRAFHAGELDGLEADEVALLVTQYRAWYEADVALVTEEIKGRAADRALVLTSRRKKIRAAVVAVTALAAGVLLILWLGGVERGGFHDGKRKVALANGKLTGLEDFPVPWQEQAKRSLSDGRLPRSEAVRGLTQSVRDAGLRAGDDLYRAFISPVNTVIQTDRPTLQWRPAQDGADYYRVVVSDREGEEICEEDVAGTEWIVPQGLLKPGRTYSWSLVAIRQNEQEPAPPEGVPDPTFVVLDEAAVKRIHEEEGVLRDSHLLLGLFYVSEGLLDDAQRELGVLAQANPESEVIQDLLRSLQRQRSGGSER